jgi:hypothetical protein
MSSEFKAKMVSDTRAKTGSLTIPTPAAMLPAIGCGFAAPSIAFTRNLSTCEAV